jgi:BioD-like phosphotransacetylase family protein
VLGLAKNVNPHSFGYIKPFGDRLLYRKKRLWDFDAALVSNMFGLQEDAEHVTVGFEHSKLRYMYDAETTRQKVIDLAKFNSEGKEILFIEGGMDLSYGTSVFLDAISISRYLNAEMLVIASRDDDTVVDDLTFLKKYIDLQGVKLAGVIVNKVKDVDEFKHTSLNTLEDAGIDVLGVIPFRKELLSYSVEYLAEFLFGKIIAGNEGLSGVVENIFVGAMSVNEAMRNPLFNKEKKLIITSGDRTDMILAALEGNTAAIILTNNILPPANIISKAAQCKIPLILVPTDTYLVAKKIDDLEPLITRSDAAKIDLLEKLVEVNVDYKKLLSI